MTHWHVDHQKIDTLLINYSWLTGFSDLPFRTHINIHTQQSSGNVVIHIGHKHFVPSVKCIMQIKYTFNNLFVGKLAMINFDYNFVPIIFIDLGPTIR